MVPMKRRLHKRPVDREEAKHEAAQPGRIRRRDPSAAGPSSPATGAGALWISLALIFINLVVYAPVRNYDFLNYDDPDYVTENPHVTAGLTWNGIWWALTTDHAANWHPLTWFSHMLDVQMYGLNPGPHHVTNVILHIANTLLLFGLLYQMTEALYRSAFVAALFAVHPLHVQSVAWLAERKDLLSTLFWILTLWAYNKYVRQPRLRTYLLMFTLFALGLMAKPMLVTLPFVLLLLDFWPLNRINFDGETGKRGARTEQASLLQLVYEKLPLFALTVSSSLVTFVVQRRGGATAGFDALPLSHRLANALTSYVLYIRNMLWPSQLGAFYPYSEQMSGWWIAAGLVLIAVSLLAIRVGGGYLLVGWLWYLGTLVPVIGFVQIGAQSIADRYTYVPLIGLFLIAAWGIPSVFARLRYSSPTLAAVGTLIILACMLMARNQLQYWKSSRTLWEHTLEVTTGNYLAHNNLGTALMLDEGGMNEAIPHFLEALQIKPNYVMAQVNLGLSMVKSGKREEGIRYYTAALQIEPQSVRAHTELANALADLGKVDEAIAHYNDALRADPGYAEAHNNLGSVLANQGKFDDAIAHYSEALRIKADYPEAHYNFGALLANLGRDDQSIAHYSEALRLKSGYAEAHNGLGLALSSQGKLDEAINQYSEALRIKPEYAAAHNNIGVALARQGRIDEALHHFSESVRINPGLADAHNNLGSALANRGDLSEAIREYSTALQISPDYTDARLNLGAVLSKTGKIGEAIHQFSEILRVEPDNRNAMQYLDDLIKRKRTAQ